MRASVVSSSYTLAEEPDDADVFVVNTCSFIQDAAEESIAAILEVAWDWLPAREDRKLVVAGCLPSRYGQDLAEAMPEVDAFVPVAEEGAILDVVERSPAYVPRGMCRYREVAPAPRAPHAALRIPAGFRRVPPPVLVLHDTCDPGPLPLPTHRPTSYLRPAARRGRHPRDHADRQESPPTATTCAAQQVCPSRRRREGRGADRRTLLAPAYVRAARRPDG